MLERTSVLRAGCKINLYLRITGVRSDGWHELDTVFLPLPEPHDLLKATLLRRDGGAVSVRCGAPGIDPERNTLTAACARFAAASGFAPSLDVALEKGIPQGSGLGGGSSDAAALLAWLNALAPKPLGLSELIDVAAGVGADVPFFLLDRPCRAEGVGERLVPCDPLSFLRASGAAILLVCPSEAVSTPWAYRAWDRWRKRNERSLTKERTSAMSQSSLRLFGENEEVLRIENSFEPPVFEAFPRLRRLKENLLRSGAAAAAMSGSGSSLFGLFRSIEGARAAAEDMRGKDVIVHVHAL